jgi:CRISPR-associated protein (TIGR03984 family)
MKHIEGCQIDRIDRAASKAWLDYVLGRGAAPMTLGDSVWLVCHCDDGVTWGRLEGGAWRLGSAAFPDLCPALSEAAIQELRVFSSTVEVLIWRTDHGLRGRVLRDSVPAVNDGPFAPHDEERLLLAGPVGGHRDGFTRVGDGTGAEQALPLRVTEAPSSSWPRLRVRHYFAREERTGCVRVVATRLVEVR